MLPCYQAYELSAKCEEVETILNQMKEQLQVITELYEPLTNSHEAVNTHFADVKKQITKINNLQQDSDINFIRKINGCRRNCDHVMNDTQMILNKKITIPENMKQNIKIVGDIGKVKTIKLSLKEKLLAKTEPEVARREKTQIKPDTQQVLRPRQINKNNEINNLELLSEIKPGGMVDMINPLELVSVGDGPVIQVDERLKYLQRINTEGEVVRKYQITLNKQEYYRSACVFGNYLFVATSDNVITKMSLDGSGGSIKYKPEGVRTINYISAVGDNVILISEYQWNGRILEYNTETNQFIERVTDVWLPGRVNVAHAGYDNKYIVKCNQPFSDESRVNIYNRDWNLISTIDGYAVALTVTPGGKLLLACNNRIHEYSQDRRLIRELSDKYKFNNIQDITCDAGCLWMLEGNPCCIKIFVANWL